MNVCEVGGSLIQFPPYFWKSANSVSAAVDWLMIRALHTQVTHGPQYNIRKRDLCGYNLKTSVPSHFQLRRLHLQENKRTLKGTMEAEMYKG